MPAKPNRRDFLGYAGLAAGTLATSTALGNRQNQEQSQPTTRPVAANDKITIGLIGCGGMGCCDLRESLRRDDVQCAAVCDVDTRHIKNAQADAEKARGTTPVGYRDYRELLARNDIDAVIIATPDHWHALPMIEACLAGKDVYLEKPIGHNIVEGRAMVAAAQKHERVVQVGTQQRSGKHFQQAIEIVRSGALGKIAMTRTWNVGNEFWEQPIGKPPDSEPPPELDYDMWLGPAPKRPHNEKRCHYYWRWFFDYGGGKCSDWNVHLLDIVHLALNVDAPRAVSASGGTHAMDDIRETYDTLEAVYEYPGFTHTYSYRATSTRPMDERKRYGIIFYGTHGTLFVDREGWEVCPETSTEKVADVDVSKYRIDYRKGGGSDQHWPHIQDFYECVRSRAQPTSDITGSHKTTTACHLANIAFRTGLKLHWDAEREICTDGQGGPLAAANRLLSREYRSPWQLPAI